MTSVDVVTPKRVRAAVTVPRKPPGRTKVTNGVTILHGLADARTHVARRYRDLLALACSDAGGVDCMSEAKLQLARRFAGLACQLEGLEAALANGESINITEYTSLTSTMVRVVSRLGTARVPKDVGGPSCLAEYFEQRHRRKEEAIEADEA
jgi:hypothetical protein